MMKKLQKTLCKTPNLINPQTTNHLYPFSISSFTTYLSSVQQQSYIDHNNETQDQKITTLPKPTQITYQSQVANWVNLIGTVKVPIKSLICDDGKAWASTLISKGKNSSTFWMPVVFQDDLAYTAMMHLKENDTVYIGGHLSSEPLPIGLTKNQSFVQIMVQNVHFVRDMENTYKKRFNHPSNSFGHSKPLTANRKGFR